MTHQSPFALVLAASLLLGVRLAVAHHSMVVEFAVEKPVTVKGTISKVVWMNPHARIYLDAKGADGHIEKWVIETGATSRMMKRGLKRDDFTIGAEVIIGGYAARDGKRSAAGMIVTFVDRDATSDREASFSLGR